MPVIDMTVIAGQLAKTCFQNEQQRLNAYAQALQVTFPLTATAVNYGISTPDVDQQLLPWYRLNADGTPDRWYSFINGFWIAPNPTPAGSALSFPYSDTLSNLALYDGGEGNYNVDSSTGLITPTVAITSTTGPMWQVNVALQGRVPLGISNTSVASQIKDAYGNVINGWTLNSTGGEIEHTLLATELAPHTHQVGSTFGATPGAGVNAFAGGPPYEGNPSGVEGGDTISSVANVPVGHNTLSPYLGVYWIQRSARGFYRV